MIHYADIVPHLMPQHSGYIHGGAEIWYDKGMEKYQQCVAEAHECSNSVKFYNTGDHSTEYYIQIPIENLAI